MLLLLLRELLELLKALSHCAGSPIEALLGGHISCFYQWGIFVVDGRVKRKSSTQCCSAKHTFKFKRLNGYLNETIYLVGDGGGYEIPL